MGNSIPYQLAISFSSAIYAFAGLMLSYHLANRYFTALVSAMTAGLIWFGTNLLGYVYFMPAMSHAVSFFAVALFLYTWQHNYGSSRHSVLSFWVHYWINRFTTISRCSVRSRTHR